MYYVAIVALPFYNIAKTHLLVVSEMTKRELELYYERIVGGGYVLAHYPLVNVNIVLSAITKLFGETPNIAITVKGYSIKELKKLIYSISAGIPCTLPEREDVEMSNEDVYSAELQKKISYLKYADGEVVPALSDEETEFEYDDEDVMIFDEDEFDAIDEQYPSSDDDENEELNKRMQFMYDLLSEKLVDNDMDEEKMFSDVEFLQD
jgi:hypothetical protein